MIGMIGIHHHRVSCIIGTLPEERIVEQDIYIDLKVKTNFTPSVQSDNLTHTINYVIMANLCTRLAQHNRYQLLETLAHDILEELLTHFPVTWAWVCIKKPSAIPSAKYAMVELEREE